MPSPITTPLSTSNPSSTKCRELLTNTRKLIGEATERLVENASYECCVDGIALPGHDDGDDIVHSPSWIRMETKEDQKDDLHIQSEGREREGSRYSEAESFELGMFLFGGGDALDKDVDANLQNYDEMLRDLISRADEPDIDGGLGWITEARAMGAKIKFLRRCLSAKQLLHKISSSAGLSSASHSPLHLAKASEDLSQAVKEVSEAEKMIVSLQSMASGDASAGKELHTANFIMESIRSNIPLEHSHLFSQANSILDTCLSVTDSSITVREHPVEGAVALSAAFDTLYNLSSPHNHLLPDAIYQLSSHIFTSVLNPLIEYNTSNQLQPLWQFRQTPAQDVTASHSTSSSTSDHSTITLEWRRRSSSLSFSPYDTDQVISSWNETLNAIRQVLAFVHTHLLLQRLPLCNIMGDYLFLAKSFTPSTLPVPVTTSFTDIDNPSEEPAFRGPLITRLLHILLHTCVPDTPHHLQKLQPLLLESTTQFEQELVQKGFLSSSPLTDFVKAFEAKYSEKRRTDILTRGRDILLKEDYHNTVVVGTESTSQPPSDKTEYVLDEDGRSVFLLPRCAVSKVASMLMDLCRSCLDEAVTTKHPPSAAPVLYRTARDLLDLFRALIPAAHGTSISTIPRTAAVCHNDCVYIAHILLTLGHEYRERFHEDTEKAERHPILLKMCTFVDFIPSFRTMGDEVLGDMLQRQKLQLVELIGDRFLPLPEALRVNEAVTEWTEAETAVRAVHYHLHHLTQSWKPILAQEVYGRAVGSLVDTLFGMLLDRVLQAEDISMQASHFVASLFRDAQRTCHNLFQEPNLPNKCCGLWDRFDAVSQFMNMSLSDIDEALSEGVFRSVTNFELSKLIAAAFDDSDKRRKILLALASDKKQLDVRM